MVGEGSQNQKKTKDSDFQIVTYQGIPNYGVSHADDLLYLWNPVFTVSVDLNGLYLSDLISKPNKTSLNVETLTRQ